MIKINQHPGEVFTLGLLQKPGNHRLTGRSIHHLYQARIPMRELTQRGQLIQAVPSENVSRFRINALIYQSAGINVANLPRLEVESVSIC